MLNKVASFIDSHQLLSREGLHIVALSGGADSVALLLVLQRLGYRVEAAHCNFHLRGEESNRDEEFVKSLCEKAGVALHLIHFDSVSYAELHKVSIEMAARDLRYGYFRQLCQDIGAETVCVAHHRDDAVETFLMNLLRGSGIHGLTGMRPRNQQVVRPLLGVSRREILDYLDSIGQDYVTDSSNLVDDVLRNKIRLKVIPLLTELNPQTVVNIDKTAKYLQEVEKIFNNEICRESSAVEHDEATGAESLSVANLLEMPAPATFLHEWLSVYGFNSTQVEQLFHGLQAGSGREFRSRSHILVLDRGRLLVESLQPPLKTLKIPEAGCYRYASNLRFDVVISDEIAISNSDNCATLDAANIRFPLYIRPVQRGDAFTPLGMNGRKLVSDFLTDRKLSVLDKRRQLVITDADSHILWLVGQRIDHKYRIKGHTSSILRITVVNTL